MVFIYRHNGHAGCTKERTFGEEDCNQRSIGRQERFLRKHDKPMRRREQA
ncbi:hypothetical protein HMPREF1548_06231 [Clostridium sp. KLE 1755]|nr:hypothetical protein HMPREF1548_06231 [Clostridium sp. KLE 1755]